MADEPREVQRLRRMKIGANKKMDQLEKFPDHPKAPRWMERLKEFTASIAVAEHEAAAATIKSELAKEGVEIKVPTKHFVVTPLEPVNAE